MANDPTVDPDGHPFQHDPFPPHAQELFMRVRDVLQDRFWREPKRIDLDTVEGQQVLQDLAARVVAQAREVYEDGD